MAAVITPLVPPDCCQSCVSEENRIRTWLCVPLNQSITMLWNSTVHLLSHIALFLVGLSHSKFDLISPLLHVVVFGMWFLTH